VSLLALSCESCGGQVAMPAGSRAPTCLFCGAEDLVEEAPPEQVELAEHYLPFSISSEDAQALFREWAGQSFWAPTELRQARLELKDLLLPAWTWSGRVETHWAALVSGSTRSGKRPTSGRQEQVSEGFLVPSSFSLSRAELGELSPFHSGGELPFDPGASPAPYELGRLTRSAATHAAREGLREQHERALDAELGASRLSTSCLYHDLQGRPLLLPVWIGAYRHGERVYRVVVNGQTGELTGKLPVSWLKVLLALGLTAGILAAGLAFLAVLVLLS